MNSTVKSGPMDEIKALTTVPKLTYNYEATPIDKIHLDDTERAAKFILPYFDKGSIRSQEEVLMIMLDDIEQPIGVFSLFKGDRTKVLAEHHLFLSLLISSRCDYFIIAHNHPTGVYLPSLEDVELTMSLKQKAHFFDVIMMDHLIITEEGHYSFADDFKFG